MYVPRPLYVLYTLVRQSDLPDKTSGALAPADRGTTSAVGVTQDSRLAQDGTQDFGCLIRLLVLAVISITLSIADWLS